MVLSKQISLPRPTIHPTYNNMAYSDGRDGKGSRDPFVEPWLQYGQRALSDYLLKNYTDYDIKKLSCCLMVSVPDVTS
jgi:hypothetical protein